MLVPGKWFLSTTPVIITKNAEGRFLLFCKHFLICFYLFWQQGRFGAIICLGPPNIYFAIKVAQDFGYLAFRTVGASEAIHRMSLVLSKVFMKISFVL